MKPIGFICDICGGDTSSSSGYPLTHCHGKKMCPNCFQEWQKGLIVITEDGRIISDAERQLNLEANGII